MDADVLEIYQMETLTQCRFSIAAFNQLLASSANLGVRAHGSDWKAVAAAHREVFRAAHSFLTHASNVSKLIWPAAPRQKKGESQKEWEDRCAETPQVRRGNELRQSLGLTDAANAIRSRKLRDHLEHFDERIDAWQATSTSHNYVQDYIGSPHDLVGIPPEDAMRWYDPGTMHMHFRGETFDLYAIRQAAISIEASVLKVLPYDVD